MGMATSHVALIGGKNGDEGDERCEVVVVGEDSCYTGKRMMVTLPEMYPRTTTFL